MADSLFVCLFVCYYVYCLSIQTGSSSFSVGVLYPDSLNEAGREWR